MKTAFVKTENVKRLMLGMAALDERGAGEACLAVLDGLPGLGKSAAVGWLSSHNDCLLVRAKKEWTPNWMLKDILEQLNIKPEFSFEKKFKQVVEALGTRADAAANAGESFALIIDEVDYISKSDKMLSTVRDISDFLEIPVVLVGMGKVRTNLKRFPQVTSRVGQYIEFQPLPITDVRKMLDELCEVKVADDLLELVHRCSKGFSREVKEAIANIERHAMRQGVAEITNAIMDGQVLLNDRATGKPIKVRG